MAGEISILDTSLDNVGNANFQPGQVVELDVANSSPIVTAVKLPAAALSECIGVVYDMAKLDQTGAVVPGQGVNLRLEGIARVTAHAAISPGDFVSVASAAGDVQTQAKAIAGAQPQPIVGRALTQATALGDTILVKLLIGGHF